MIGICCVFMHKINDTPNFSNHNVFFFFFFFGPSDAKAHKQSALFQF